MLNKKYYLFLLQTFYVQSIPESGKFFSLFRRHCRHFLALTINDFGISKDQTYKSSPNMLISFFYNQYYLFKIYAIFFSQIIYIFKKDSFTLSDILSKIFMRVKTATEKDTAMGLSFYYIEFHKNC